jgi:hypothetical protein
MLTTLFMLVYGDYPAMHRQAIAPLLGQDPEKVSVRLWLNSACLGTFDWLLKHAPESWLIYVSSQNCPKYPVMQKLFNDPEHPIVTPWVTWLDDDTRIIYSDWFSKTEEYIEDTPTVDFFGAQYWKTHLAGVQGWIKAAPWYKGRPFMRGDATRGPNKGRLGIAFLRGSYWWLRTDLLRELNWPDPRLNHNGGDTALSEAIWQARKLQLHYAYGIDNELAPRRGRSERPAGFKHDFVNRTDGSNPDMLGRLDLYERRLDNARTPFLKLNDSTLLIGGTSEYTDVDWLVPPKDLRPNQPPAPKRQRSRRSAAVRRKRPVQRKRPPPGTAKQPEPVSISEAARRTTRARLLEKLRKKRLEKIRNEQRRIQREQQRRGGGRRQDSRPR